jgi:hypothetical protein
MMETASTYRVVQAVGPRLELTEKALERPGPGEVRIRAKALRCLPPGSAQPFGRGFGERRRIRNALSQMFDLSRMT